MEIDLSDSIIERSNCVKYLGIFTDKLINFYFHFVEVVKKTVKTTFSKNHN